MITMTQKFDNNAFFSFLSKSISSKSLHSRLCILVVGSIFLYFLLLQFFFDFSWICVEKHVTSSCTTFSSKNHSTLDYFPSSSNGLLCSASCIPYAIFLDSRILFLRDSSAQKLFQFFHLNLLKLPYPSFHFDHPILLLFPVVCTLKIIKLTCKIVIMLFFLVHHFI